MKTISAGPCCARCTKTGPSSIIWLRMPRFAMSKADMQIARVHSGLADCRPLPPSSSLCWREEHDRTEAAVLRLAGQQALLDQSRWLQRAIRLRNPYIDPMSYVQVAFLPPLPRCRGKRGQRYARGRSAQCQRRGRRPAQHGVRQDTGFMMQEDDRCPQGTGRLLAS